MKHSEQIVVIDMLKISQEIKQFLLSGFVDGKERYKQDKYYKRIINDQHLELINIIQRNIK